MRGSPLPHLSHDGIQPHLVAVYECHAQRRAAGSRILGETAGNGAADTGSSAGDEDMHWWSPIKGGVSVVRK
ncbi:hypothetical protein GCM10022234_23200 [Aeromicrobium panaciterrae]